MHFPRYFATLLACTLLATSLPATSVAEPAVLRVARPAPLAKGEAGLRVRAEAGDVTAQFELGHMLYQRMLISKVPFDGFDEAMRWLSLAEHAGYVPAKAHVAFLLMWGPPPPGGRDYVRAHRLAEEGAALDDPLAIYLLSGAYQAGHGVEKDPTKSIALAVRAADLGWLNAQLLVAEVYLFGIVVGKDPLKAEHYLKLAAQAGDVKSQARLGGLYLSGEKWGFKQDLPAALLWLSKSAKANDPNAQTLLGIMYCEGTGTARSVPRGKHLLKKALVQGHEDAREVLTECGAKTAAR